MIANAFDEQSVEASSRLADATVTDLRFSFRSLIRDPDGKLTWEQRIRTHLSNLNAESLHY